MIIQQQGFYKLKGKDTDNEEKYVYILNVTKDKSTAAGYILDNIHDDLVEIMNTRSTYLWHINGEFLGTDDSRYKIVKELSKYDYPEYYL